MPPDPPLLATLRRFFLRVADHGYLILGVYLEDSQLKDLEPHLDTTDDRPHRAVGRCYNVPVYGLSDVEYENEEFLCRTEAFVHARIEW